MTVSKEINDFNYSFKRISIIPIRRNGSKNIECRGTYEK